MSASKATTVETIRCDLCGADDSALVLREKDRLHHIEGIFDLVRCCRCGLMYINPRPGPEEMSCYYPEDYGPYRVVSRHSSFLNRLDKWYGSDKRRRAVLARAPRASGRVLDIGCSTGAFLEAMRRQPGWEAYGVEVNVEVARYAREVIGLDVFAGTLDEAQYPDAFFDIVTLWDVLEHLHGPRETLAEVARIVKPGGLLVASIPNPSCPEARLFAEYWAGWDAPRHLYIFTCQTLSQVLNQVGFEVREFASFTGRYQVTILSLGNWLDDHVSQQAWRRLLKRAVGSLPIRLLTLPFYAIADRLNQSSVITVFAQRRLR